MKRQETMNTTKIQLHMFALVCAVTVAAANTAYADDVRCRPVSGSISASVVTNPNVSKGLALGTVTGDLSGSTMATFSADDAGGLQLNHNFVTDARDTLNTTDTGALVPVPNLDGVFRMSVTYTITGGTGRFTNASGTLQNHGEADLNQGLLTLTYTGSICTPRGGSLH